MVQMVSLWYRWFLYAPSGFIIGGLGECFGAVLSKCYLYVRLGPKVNLNIFEFIFMYSVVYLHVSCAV